MASLMPKVTLGTVLKLLFASLVVGAAMAWLEVTPDDFWNWTVRAAGSFAENLAGRVNTAIKYVLLGAVIVVPIWLLSYAFKALRGRG